MHQYICLMGKHMGGAVPELNEDVRAIQQSVVIPVALHNYTLKGLAPQLCIPPLLARTPELQLVGGTVSHVVGLVQFSRLLGHILEQL